MADPILLYDIPSKAGTCWSPNVWKTRLLLNFKGIDYRTEWIQYPDIAPKFKSLGISAHPPRAQEHSVTEYTVPAVRLPDGTYVMESKAIVKEIEKLQPEPSARLLSSVLPKVEQAWAAGVRPLIPVLAPLTPGNVLAGSSVEYYREARKKGYGMSLEDFQERYGGEQAWEKAMPGLKQMVEILKADESGPFVLGDEPSWSDFLIVGFLHWSRCLDEEAFKRIVGIDPVFERVYEACGPWLERNDR